MTQPAGHHVNESAGSAAPLGLGRWLWQRGNVLLLLDGLDEIAAREAREQRSAVARFRRTGRVTRSGAVNP
jgi:hypothetical protein